MNILFWGLTLGVIGKVMVVLAVMFMHHTLMREHEVDYLVVRTFHKERFFTIVGLLLIVLGYIMEVYFYAPTSLFTCQGPECAAMLGGAVLP